MAVSWFSAEGLLLGRISAVYLPSIMNWIVASLMMFLSSVALYSFVRRSNQLKTPQQLNNLAMFLIPVVAYVFLSINANVRFAFKPFEYTLIVAQAILFSYLGNTFSLKAIEYAPNPGYSLIISKSYVVFTAIASVFLFGASLSMQSAFAIMLIISFSTLIMVDKERHTASARASWFPYTIGAFFCWGLLALSSKYLLTIGVPILSRLIYTMSIVSALILMEMKAKKVTMRNVTKPQLLTLLAIGVFSTSFNYFLQMGYDLAPNVGYVNAANASSIALLSVTSAFVFRDDLSVRKMVGVIGVTVGLFVLFL